MRTCLVCGGKGHMCSDEVNDCRTCNSARKVPDPDHDALVERVEMLEANMKSMYKGCRTLAYPDDFRTMCPLD